MKFSDLVVLGSTMIEFESATFLQDGCGCFIGMAAAAKTGRTHANLSDEVLREFPWLKKRQEPFCRCPVCGATYFNYSASISCVAHHVKSEAWTFEQGLNYIRSIEPPDAPEEADAPDTAIPVWNRYQGVRS